MWDGALLAPEFEAAFDSAAAEDAAILEALWLELSSEEKCILAR